MRLPASRALEVLQKGKVAPGYVLLGSEIYWRDRFWRALRLSVSQDEPGGEAAGIWEFDLRQNSLAHVLEKARTPSLLSSRQLLLVRNAQGLSARKVREPEASPSRKAGAGSSDDLAAYFSDPEPFSILVLEMLDIDLQSEDWRDKEKARARLEAFGELCDVILLAAPSFGEAMELIRQEFAAREQTITSDAAERLALALNCDMGRLRMEIEKLSLLHPERSEIDAGDLDDMVGGGAGRQGLSLNAAVGSGKAKEALEVVARLEREGKYPPLVILEMTRYLRQLIVLKENKVREPRQAGKVLWSARLPAPQSSVPGLVEQARNLSHQRLVQGLELAFEAEMALRSNPPDDRIILEQFVIRLIEALQSSPRIQVL